MNRTERTRARINDYLLAHTDAATANYFINLWDSAEVGTVCNDVRTIRRDEHPPIYTNSARNKLTEYGNKVALEYLLQIPQEERMVKHYLYDFEELQQQLSKGFVSSEQKEMFLTMRDFWFKSLKELMKELSIKKETLEKYGLNWKEAKSFAYQTL